MGHWCLFWSDWREDFLISGSYGMEDASLFAREDSVEAAWRVVDPILGDVTPVYEYEPNTWGPPEAGRIIGGDDGWRNPKEATE